jgi:ubiquinone/menaquinone biosynthesis C-methylase UbiE
MSDQLLDPVPSAAEVPERFDPAKMQGAIIEAEHLARYRWAASLVSGRSVLDAGCGTAYGSALLAEAGAAKVVGVDRASEVLDSVRDAMPAGVMLEAADVTALPYEDASFDVVVCFEVIEHVANPGGALDEFRRVLSPNGVLAVSSPNSDVYPLGNPHHVYDYTPAALEHDLLQRFGCVRLERQHTWITSGVLDDDHFRTGEDGDVGTDAHIRKLEANAPGAELYTVALAGDTELPSTVATFELAHPVELRKWSVLWDEQTKVLAQQERVLREQADLLSTHQRLFAEHSIERDQLQYEIDELRRQLVRGEEELARLPALDSQLADLVKLNDDLLRVNAELAQRQVAFEELAQIAERYTVVVSSTSWRLTRPLRDGMNFARRLLR